MILESKVKAYVRLIKSGLRTIDDVEAEYKDAIQMSLNARKRTKKGE